MNYPVIGLSQQALPIQSRYLIMKVGWVADPVSPFLQEGSMLTKISSA